jgi:hypothetical protein
MTNEPYLFPLRGRNFVRSNNDKECKGFSEKRMSICKGLNSGSNFARIQKDANLLMVFSCVNGRKLTNVRYSKTLIGERLTASNVNWLLSRITKSIMQIADA